jgi:hypothetical protein
LQCTSKSLVPRPIESSHDRHDYTNPECQLRFETNPIYAILKKLKEILYGCKNTRYQYVKFKFHADITHDNRFVSKKGTGVAFGYALTHDIASFVSKSKFPLLVCG